jgi:hypothetical protein
MNCVPTMIKRMKRTTISETDKGGIFKVKEVKAFIFGRAHSIIG